jgi:hypothetical protein
MIRRYPCEEGIVIKRGDIIGMNLSGRIAPLVAQKRWPRLIALSRKIPVFIGIAIEDGVEGELIGVAQSSYDIRKKEDGKCSGGS